MRLTRTGKPVYMKPTKAIPEEGGMRNQVSRSIVLGLALALWILVVLQLVTQLDVFQWDFATYYAAAKMFSEGLNPYDLSRVARTTGGPIFPFLYLPVSIFFFEPFTLLSLPAAKLAFLLTKCAILIGVLALWQLKFLDNPTDGFFILFCLLAFNSAICLDLQSGNISSIEQAILWGSFFFFIRGNMYWFCLLLILSSVFRLTPLAFGMLLLVQRDSGRYRSLALFGGVCTLFVLANFILDPNLMKQFLSQLPHIGLNQEDIGIKNPATLSMVKFWSRYLQDVAGIAVSRTTQMAAYGVVALAVFIVSAKAMCRLNMSSMEQRKQAVYIAVLAYTIMMPRFQDYQWALLLVPTYALMLRRNVVSFYPVLFLFSILSAKHITVPGGVMVSTFVWNYYPWLLAVAVWAMSMLDEPGSETCPEKNPGNSSPGAEPPQAR